MSRFLLALGLFLCLGAGLAARMQGQSIKSKEKKESVVVKQAKGSFEVKLTPQASEEKSPEIGRMLLEKQFQGDLTGTSNGQMLALMTSVKDSAGYVAMERVTGELHGRKGSFALQHSGTMERGAQSLSITVVPDSGTEQLVGLAGKMTIKIEGGKHFYEFEYTIPESH